MGERARRGAAFPHCHPRDLALRLPLTPRPRSCWPRILHVRLLFPQLCALCREAARHSLHLMAGRGEGPRESLGSLLPGVGLFPLVYYSVMPLHGCGRVDICTLRSDPAAMPFIPLLSGPYSALRSTPTWLRDLLKGTRGEASPQRPVGLPWDTTVQAGSTCPACCLGPPGLTTATGQTAPEVGEMRRCWQALPLGGQGGSDQRLHLCSTPLPSH